jgi:nitrite reductase/ring-hydroxylating ferredoxin subunit/uncharacterized membrane protein
MRWLTMTDVIEPLIKRMPFLEQAGTQVKTSVHQAIVEGGEGTRSAADTLHGTWLGHPLHPVLTDVTIGAWTFAVFFDVMWLITQKKGHRRTADMLTRIGTVSAIPTAMAGITDYSAIKKDAVAHGALHGIINAVGLVLNILSIRARDSHHHSTGRALSFIAFGGLLISAWIGGEMTYRLRVGVNHSKAPSEPKDWTPVMPDYELLDRQPRRIEVMGYPVLIYREGEHVNAIGAICSHAGGPLEKGKFYDGCVQCPWHDSVYRLDNGQVVHGPSTYHQPRYETRIYNGQIEVRIIPEESILAAPNTPNGVVSVEEMNSALQG